MLQLHFVYQKNHKDIIIHESANEIPHKVDTESLDVCG